MPLEENFGNAQEDTKINRNILSPTLIAQKLVSGINRWNSMELKCFWTEKEIFSRTHSIGDNLHELYFRKGASTQKLQNVKSKYQETKLPANTKTDSLKEAQIFSSHF